MRARFRRSRERSRLILREISLPRELKSGWGGREKGRLKTEVSTVSSHCRVWAAIVRGSN